jgi:hypothetical protein
VSAVVFIEYVGRLDPVGRHGDGFAAHKEVRGPDELSPVGGGCVCSW